MGIDSFTLFAQLINLFVLIWLLKRFLYQPVLQIITKRAKEIETMNQSSFLLKKEIEESYLNLEKEKRNFEKKLQLQKEEMSQNFLIEKKKETEILKEEIARKREILLEEVKSEKNQIKTEATRLITKDFSKLIEKILTDFTQNTPFEQIFNLFIVKFKSLKNNEIEKLNKELKKQNIILINSSETLTQKQKEEISSFLEKQLIFTSKTKLIFNNKPDLIMGIEVALGNYCVQWCIKGYINEFQENLDKHLNQI